MTIRKETPNDYEEVYSLVKASFATASHSDGTEQDYLNAIRKTAAFIPELSLVAQADAKIVGQIVLYEMQIKCAAGNEVQLVLSPLSVHPDYFGQGIGATLISADCKRAADKGYKAVFLCGSYDYYSKSGFVPTFRYGIYHENDAEKNAAWCMVKELKNGYLATVSGVVDIE